jgi:hypothetical protein
VALHGERAVDEILYSIEGFTYMIGFQCRGDGGLASARFHGKTFSAVLLFATVKVYTYFTLWSYTLIRYRRTITVL